MKLRDLVLQQTTLRRLEMIKARLGDYPERSFRQEHFRLALESARLQREQLEATREYHAQWLRHATHVQGSSERTASALSKLATLAEIGTTSANRHTTPL